MDRHVFNVQPASMFVGSKIATIRRPKVGLSSLSTIALR